MWKARDLTLFGKVFIILRCTQLLTRIVPREVVRNVQGRLFKFFMEQKKKRQIRRSGLYQEYENGGLHMVDFELMIKSL